jgi:hypothetical protein
MKRQTTIDGVAWRQGACSRGAIGRERPPLVGDLGRAWFSATPCREDDERQIARASRIRLVPTGELDPVRVDELHVDDASRKSSFFARATQNEHLAEQLFAHGSALGICDEEARGGAVNGFFERGAWAAGTQQDRHRTDAAQRSGHREVTGTRLHQHGHWLAASYAALDQASDDVVHTAIRLRI